jgi:hypothetical protein
MNTLNMPTTHVKIFIEGLFKFIKMGHQTSDTYLVITMNRIFTTNDKDNVHLVKHFNTHLDILFDNTAIDTMDKTTRLFMQLIRTSDLRSGIICIDIEAFYGALHPIFNPPKGVGKSKTIWNYIQIGVVNGGTIYDGAMPYFNAIVSIYRENTCIGVSSQLRLDVSMPRMIAVQNVPLTVIYGHNYKYIGYAAFDNEHVNAIYNSSIPIDINFAQIDLTWMTEYSMRFPHTSSFYISISRNMLIREFTKCNHVVSLLYESIDTPSLYILRFAGNHEGYVLGTDAKVFGVSLA